MADVEVVADLQSLAVSTAAHLATLIHDAIVAHGSAVVCLTGGNTARPIYEMLADPGHGYRRSVDWSLLHLFWSDERHVPPDHPDSNFGMADRALLSHVPVPSSHVHRMRGELPDAGDAARAYEVELDTGFTAAGRKVGTLDVMLLGIGEDAHIASIFPGSELIESGSGVRDPGSGVRDPGSGVRRVAAVWAAHLNAWRITLTPSVLLDASSIVVVASGTKKADAVRAALVLPPDVEKWPAQLLRTADPRVSWLLDQEAAGLL